MLRNNAGEMDLRRYVALQSQRKPIHFRGYCARGEKREREREKKGKFVAGSIHSRLQRVLNAARILVRRGRGVTRVGTHLCKTGITAIAHFIVSDVIGRP
jgi:hypothetical protein